MVRKATQLNTRQTIAHWRALIFASTFIINEKAGWFNHIAFSTGN